MRSLFFIILMTFGLMNVNAQCEDSKSGSSSYGFSLGLNHSNLISKSTLPDGAELNNGPGFRLGIVADIPMSSFLSFSPKTELSFNGGKVLFNESLNQSDYEIMPVDVEFALHLVLKQNKGSLKPYFLLGPNVKIPIGEKSKTSTTFDSSPDVAVDFGIGMEIPFTYFHLLPELKYSFGLLNVNQNPSIKDLYFHNFSLIFNFMG